MYPISEELLNAYKTTTYTVAELGLNIKIEVQNKPLKRFLAQQTVKTWAFITAWNPESQELSLAENRSRNQTLQQQLNSKGFSTFEGLGVPDKGDWTPEESLFILGVARQHAIDLGKKYEQNAIVFGEAGKIAELIVIT